MLTWLTDCDVVTLFMLLINSELRCLLAVAITLCKLNVSYVNSLFATKNIIIMQQNSQISYLAKRKLILPACCYLFYVYLCVCVAILFLLLLCLSGLGRCPVYNPSSDILRTCVSPGVLAEAS